MSVADTATPVQQAHGHGLVPRHAHRRCGASCGPAVAGNDGCQDGHGVFSRRGGDAGRLVTA